MMIEENMKELPSIYSSFLAGGAFAPGHYNYK